MSGYLSRAGGRDAIDPRSLLWWRAAALLQVAVRRYRRLDVPDWRLVPVLADAVEALLATPRRTSAPANGTDLLDRRQMTTLLRLALAPAATHPDALQLDSVEELASASGRRSVVRYAVRGLDGAEAVPVVGKAFTESHRARLLHDHLEALTAGPFGRGSLRVPEPVGLLAEQRLVLYRSCEGERLDHASDPDLALAGVRGAARWLARLHTSDVRLPRRFSMTAEAGSSRRWAELIGQHHPVDAHRARGVADGWALAARAAGVFLDTPIHKDFHAGHVLIAVPTGMTSGVGAEAMAGSTIAVLDLDEARHGDPAFDVAHFCAYLELTGHPRGQVETLRTAFLDEYAARSGWADRGTFAPFSAYSWLKIAKQWTVGSGPCRGASDAERAAGVDHAMAKAESWLTA